MRCFKNLILLHALCSYVNQFLFNINNLELPFAVCLQCFDAVGWAAGRASGLWKTEWWGADVVVCLERGADLHMAQLMPLPLTVSCFSKIQICFTFLVPAHLGSPRKRAVKRCVCVGVCVCVWVCVCVCACEVMTLCFVVCSSGWVMTRRSIVSCQASTPITTFISVALHQF